MFVYADFIKNNPACRWSCVWAAVGLSEVKVLRGGLFAGVVFAKPWLTVLRTELKKMRHRRVPGQMKNGDGRGTGLESESCAWCPWREPVPVPILSTALGALWKMVLWALADKWLWQQSLPWISAWALTAGLAVFVRGASYWWKLPQHAEGKSQQLWVRAGQSPGSDTREAVWLFLSNLLEGEFHSETSCIDGVMFPADSFAVCTAASLNSAWQTYANHSGN